LSVHRGIAVAFVASAAASLGLVVVYVTGRGGAQVEGILLAVALGGVGAGIVSWAIGLLHGPLEIEQRHEMASPPAERRAAASALDIEEISRRRFLVRLLAASGALLAAALALPAFSLGPQPGRALFQTGWRRGVRLVDADGKPLRLDDLAVQGVRTVFPENEVGRADSQTMLIRLRPSDLQLPEGRDGWAPEGHVAYSKLCTHAGCPVGLYRAQDKVLICPCHQSTFDVTRGAVPIFGPAARPLPQLPLDVDADGYLVATGGYDSPAGPSFWNLTHDEESSAAGEG
jgi:ubiquinol-cytochrome c reductase iron-sulfur subunit